jgi:uncharacterized protein DUF4136
MIKMPALRPALAAALCLTLVVAADAAKIKVRAEPDPDYDFATVHTWAFDDDAGEVIMARTQTDDPAPVKARVDPLIRKYVEAAMAKKGLAAATTAPPDVHLHYYVLVTVNSSGQYMGQFLPAVPYWGLPAFSAGSATSLSIVTKGSLVLDAMLPGKVGDRRVIWRGIAESTVEDTDSPAVREARIRDAAEGLVEKFPLKKKKK